VNRQEANRAVSATADVRTTVVGLGISCVGLAGATDRIVQWATEASAVGRYVCAANVHMVMEALDNPDFRAVVDGADLVLPDGMPLVFAQRLLGRRDAARARGVELTSTLLDRAAREGVPVAFYGGTPETLARLLETAKVRFPGLRVAAAISPPFRPLTPAEDAAFTAQLAGSGARIVLAGIGCPKQERWMAEHVGRIPAVLVGVGQAFDLLAGVVREAPRWMHDAGLSWLHRLAQEPRRLFWRYAKNNPRFLAHLAVQVLRERGARLSPAGGGAGEG
jgi:N-acetylglucosaminyldiphosphoundecaprenol N-acetyl-beta-D-mannosaminyltransferase